MQMRWDLWEAFGLLGEGLFFARMAAQWLASEKAGRPVIPRAYWYMSLAGALIVAAYAIHLGSVAVLLPQIIGLVFYARSLQLELAAARRDARRRALGLDRAEYPWPTVSVLVPAHNEAARLPAVLENLLAQEYPGPAPEIVVGLNGCDDGSREAAARYPVVLAESPRAGMSFGKNLAAGAARGELLVFVDADTTLPFGALRKLAEAAAGKTRYIGTVAGAPDKGGAVVRCCFLIANFLTRRKKAHAPGGVMLMDRGTFATIGGFDETLPQGTSTDCIRRGMAAGAEYVFVASFKAVTSIRRFEKTGIIRQMLAWRKNHRDLDKGRRDAVANRSYENVR